MLFLVIQQPKHRYRTQFVTFVAAIDAETKTAAIRFAMVDTDAFSKEREFSKPYAVEAKVGLRLRL